MKKTLLVCTSYMGLSGITSVIRNYLSVPCGNVRFDFVFCASADEEISRFFAAAGRIFIPPVSRQKRPLSYCRWLTRLLRENRYDAVHVHGNSGTMFFDIHAAKKADIPIRIAHSHSTGCTFRTAHRILKPFLNRELTHAVACSDLAGKWLFTKPFTVLPNGIDTERFRFSEKTRAETRCALGLPEDAFVIGHVGTFSPVKNQKFLVEAFARVRQKRQNAVLLLIGDGSCRAEAEALAASLGMGNAVLLPGNRTDVERLYCAMDLFALPSLFEGLPVTLVEAQTSGLPCVVSDAVTREADLTGNMVFLPIGEKNTELWADALAGAAAVPDRITAAAPVEQSLFNIRNCADMLRRLYETESEQTQ